MIKKIIATVGLTLSLCVPSFANSLTLETFQFVGNGNVKHYGVAGRIDIGQVSISGRQTLDQKRWKENKFTTSFTQPVGKDTYFKLEYENYYNRNEERAWLFCGKKISF